MSELGERIYERAHITGEFRLRSGATSTEYFDKYLFESDPRLLRDRGAEIAAVLCVIDREAGGRESLAREGLDLRALFTMSELRPSLGS